MRLRNILPVILAAGWALVGAQAEASEVAHAPGWKKKRLEALRAKVAAEKAELSRLRGEIAHARVMLAGHKRSTTQTESTATPATPPATGNVANHLTTARAAELHEHLRSSPALEKVVRALARTAARDEEARVKHKLQVKEAKLEDAKPTAARNPRVKALLSWPSTARTAQAVAMKVSRAEEALLKMEDASAVAKRKLQIQEAKDFLAAAQDDLKEHDQEAKQFLSAALEALKDGDADHKVAERSAAAAKAHKAAKAQKALEVERSAAAAKAHKVAEAQKALEVERSAAAAKANEAAEAQKSLEVERSAAAAKASEAAEAQKALEVKKVRGSLILRKLRAEKAKEKAKLAALKARLQKAKNAILKVREATSRVKQVSLKLPAEPLEPQAVSINLARIHNKARHASSQLSKAQKLASVVRKLEVDKAAEQRALEQEKQSHKAVMTDMKELQKVEAKLLSDIHH